jgi:hypothetical protein
MSELRPGEMLQPLARRAALSFCRSRSRRCGESSGQTLGADMSSSKEPAPWQVGAALESVARGPSDIVGGAADQGGQTSGSMTRFLLLRPPSGEARLGHLKMIANNRDSSRGVQASHEG